MPIPVADLVTLLNDNRQKRFTDLVERVDASIAKMFSFPVTIGFSKQEDRNILLDIAKAFQASGYNVLLTVTTSSQDNRYILTLNHGTPYTNAIGNHALFTC